MSVEQMRLYQAYVTKSLEAREAEQALQIAMEQDEGGDAHTSEALGSVRRVLADQKFRLSGNECVLLACLSKRLEGEDFTDTKRINILLHSFSRKPSNTTKVVDSLEKKEFLEIRSDGLHAHKMYCLTDRGQHHVWALLERLTGESGSDRLAVVD
ncbi:MAG: hypothetical protein AB8F34_05630 [Akkermansiaceae bacterium]